MGGGASVPSTASRRRAETLARRGLRILGESAQETTHGIRFRSNSAAIEEGLPAYPGTLYDGAAGVALAMLEAAPLDPSGRTFRLGREVVGGLISSTPPGPSADATGLYLGLAGTAVVIARWAVANGDPAWLAEALRVMALAGEAQPATCDVLGGAAGVGLGALALYRATGDARARAVIHACVERLGISARPDRSGLSWPLGEDAPDGSARADDVQTGFAHGTAGIATFLTAAAESLDDARARELRDGAFRSLDGLMRLRDGEAAWPVGTRQPLERHHWCHGSAGIAQAYLALYELSGQVEALIVAAAAAEHTWRAVRQGSGVPADRASGHCHGLAGALELFGQIGAATHAPVWATRADAVVRAITKRSPGRGASSLDADGCGLAYGTAGVVRSLTSWAHGAHWLVWRAFPEGHAESGAAVARAATAPLNDVVRPRTRRVTLPAGFQLQDIVPTAAGALEGHGYALPVGPEHSEAVARFASSTLGTESGRELRRVLSQLRRVANDLTRAHAEWLADDALGEPVFGPLVRECAGLLLRPGDQPVAARRRVVRSLVDRQIAALQRCLDNVARDRSTHLAALGEGRVIRVEHVGGDPHRGCGGVFGLTFADGRRALHKPRSVLLDAFLAGAHESSAARRVSAQLSPPYEGAMLPQHDVVPAGSWHGYVEQVRSTYSPLGDTDSALHFRWPTLGRPPAEAAALLAPGTEPRFWYSTGLLAGHATCFGIGDLHGENLVFGTSRAVKEPLLHAVDLEMAFMAKGGVSEAHLAPAFGHEIPVDPKVHQHFGFQARHGGLCAMGAEEWCVLVTPSGVMPTRRPHQLAGRHAPNAVRNSDGRFGYGDHLCAVVRGFTDYWVAARPIHAALAQSARTELTGAMVRVVVNASRAYVAPRHVRMLGGPLWPGASWFGAYGDATPLHEAELAQLDALDLPYFFQRLGTPGPRWMNESVETVTDLVPFTTIADPFWSVIEAFRSHEVLARGLADLVAFGAPHGPFDQRDDALGVRVGRVSDDPRLQLAVATADGVLRFRLELDGAVRWWES